MRGKRRHVFVMTASLLGGGTLLQFGNCAALAANLTLGAIDFCSFSLTPECTFGPVAPCGIPDFATIDANGVIGPVQNAEDDLLLDCPVTLVPIGTGT
jgi:hypothetical protein